MLGIEVHSRPPFDTVARCLASPLPIPRDIVQVLHLHDSVPSINVLERQQHNTTQHSTAQAIIRIRQAQVLT
jgi:hypothetical protein